MVRLPLRHTGIWSEVFCLGWTNLGPLAVGPMTAIDAEDQDTYFQREVSEPDSVQRGTKLSILPMTVKDD